MKKLTEAEKSARQEAKAKAKELATIEAERSQKPVKQISISIEWKKSRTWGNCPRAEASVWFKDGTFERNNGFYASGCGYDKESTVIGEIFNTYLKYKIWAMTTEQIKGGNGSFDNGPAPYGVHSDRENHRSFGQGIGVNCFYRISEYIGGKFECLASGKTFDVYKYTDNE